MSEGTLDDTEKLTCTNETLPPAELAISSSEDANGAIEIVSPSSLEPKIVATSDEEVQQVSGDGLSSGNNLSVGGGANSFDAVTPPPAVTAPGHQEDHQQKAELFDATATVVVPPQKDETTEEDTEKLTRAEDTLPLAELAISSSEDANGAIEIVSPSSLEPKIVATSDEEVQQVIGDGLSSGNNLSVGGGANSFDAVTPPPAVTAPGHQEDHQQKAELFDATATVVLPPQKDETTEEDTEKLTRAEDTLPLAELAISSSEDANGAIEIVSPSSLEPKIVATSDEEVQQVSGDGLTISSGNNLSVGGGAHSFDAVTPPPAVTAPGHQEDHQLAQHHQQAELFGSAAATVVVPPQKSDTTEDDTDASSSRQHNELASCSAKGGEISGKNSAGGAKTAAETKAAKTKLCSIL